MAVFEQNIKDVRSWLFSSPYFLLMMTTLFWAGNAVAGKYAVGEIDSNTLTFLRWLLASVCLLLFAWRQVIRDREIIRKNLAYLFTLGAIGFSGFNLCMYWALNYTSVVNVVIEQAAIPVLIMIFNFLAFRLGVRLFQVIGLLFALAGVILTVTRGAPASFLLGGVNQGDGIMMLAALCYALYSIGLRWRPVMHWKSFLFALTVSALIVSFTTWLIYLTIYGFEMPSAKGLSLVLYVGIFPSLISQLFYVRGVELIGANRAGLFINMVPIFGSLLAIVVLGEHFYWFHGVGLSLVVGGILLAEHSARAKAVPKPSPE